MIGYTLSKILGVKIISETRPDHRAHGILLLAIAWLALPGIYRLPTSAWRLVAFSQRSDAGHGVWAVLGFLEGRRMTESVAAGLCASFILADGFTKSVGAWLVLLSHSTWMPFCAGALFMITLDLCLDAGSDTSPGSGR